MARHVWFATLLVFGLIATATDAADVRGVVGQIDLEKKELTLEARGAGVRGQRFTFTVTVDTRILVGGQAAKLSDLGSGKRARVSYETRDGKHVATSISLLNLLGLLDAVPAPTPAPAPTSTPATGDSVTGELRRVALTDRELVILSPDGSRETILTVPEDIAVTRQGKPARFEDLKEGEHATVKHGSRDGKGVALTVQVGDGPVAGNPEDNRIQRLRRVLKLVDVMLDLADRNK